MERITIMDVARHAGVSQTTVSRVLNGDAAVKEKTRETVLKSIKLLRYQPNQAARSLAGKRAARIGIFFEKPYGGYTADLLVAALRECSLRGHMLVADEVPTGGPGAFVSSVEASMGELNAILLPPLTRSTKNVVAMLGHHKTPLVSLSGPESEIHAAGYNTVGIDDFAAAKETTEYLLELGHRHIGFISGLGFQVVSQRRYEGYCAAIQEAGFEVEADLVEDGNFSYNSGMEAMRKLLARDEVPTAVFASNDDMAAGAVGCAFQHGLRVPEDISIIGFDDSPMAQSVAPNLTSVKQPVRQMVAKALDLLEGHPNFPGNTGKKPAGAISHHFLPHELTIRESVRHI